MLVTGASGKVGKALTPKLVQHGYAVRALTSRMRTTPTPDIDVEWRVRDFRRSDLDFKDEVSGVVAIVHLAAELRHADDMVRTNVEASAALAKAAETEGVKFLCYLSSVSVYGSSVPRKSFECSSVLSVTADFSSEYWGSSALRCYGRTKLLGEKSVVDAAVDMECVILRPTVIVDDRDIHNILTGNRMQRILLSYRTTHHINIQAVTEAIIWALTRSRDPLVSSPGVTIYNLSDQEAGTFAQLFTGARSAGVGSVNKLAPPLPAIFGWAKDYVRFRGGWPVRRPLGLMSLPNDKLTCDGSTCATECVGCVPVCLLHSMSNDPCPPGVGRRGEPSVERGVLLGSKNVYYCGVRSNLCITGSRQSARVCVSLMCWPDTQVRCPFAASFASPCPLSESVAPVVAADPVPGDFVAALAEGAGPARVVGQLETIKYDDGSRGVVPTTDGLQLLSRLPNFGGNWS